MTSPCKHVDRPAGRHDFVFVRPEGWRALLIPHGELACDPLVLHWAELGWPTIRRRALPCETTGLALGLPLPPSAGKKRLSLLAGLDDIVAVARPPSLREVRTSAPRCWQPTLDRLDEVALRHSAHARVFGSLAWEALTGLDYVTARSDLDLLFEIRPETDLDRLVADLAAIEIEAPMRLDGELVRADGAAANWRELHASANELLVKSIEDVTLLGRDRFISGATGS